MLIDGALPLSNLPPPSKDEHTTGKKLLSAPEPLVGTILLAGGAGSRLQYGVKGFLPLSGKTLFEIFLEKMTHYQKIYQSTFPLAIMTNQRSANPVQAFLRQKKTTFPVDFFTQGSLPLLSTTHTPLPVEGPNGNGLLFKYFCSSPIYKKWLSLGVKYISVVPIDNPLAESIDPGLLGAVHEKTASIGITCVPCLTEQESGGRMASVEGKIQVLEHAPTHMLKHYPLVNTGIYMFDISCIEDFAYTQLPLHIVPKQWQKQTILKREYFLLDLFPLAERVIARKCLRRLCFHPIKTVQDIQPAEQAFLLKRFYTIT